MATGGDTSTPGIIRNILNSQYLAVLASVSGNLPYSNLVAFAASDDLRYLFFVTGRQTRKYANIAANAGVSLLIDSRTDRKTDFTDSFALTALGSAGEVRDGERPGPAAVYLHRHPYLADFLGAADSALMRVAVAEYVLAGFGRKPHVVIP